MAMRYLWAAALLFIASSLPAQHPYTMPVNITAAITKETRTVTGEPGKNYWQNTADYNIQVNFNPATRLLQGHETISYINNSPDSLRQIVFKLYPNLYEKGGARASSIEPADVTDGVNIDTLQLDDKLITGRQRRINGTNMSIRLPKQILPHQQVQFSISWSYILNKKSHIRTGEIDPGADFVAYFFPRIAVYDDIDGWNMYPYDGNLEFYNDFCHFNVAITVPANEVVWATGNLTNGGDVLAAKNYQRLMDAQKNDALAYIIDNTDLANNDYTNHAGEFNTWMYDADDVTDFAFACSDHYLWQSTSLVVDPATGRRTRVDAAYNPKHKDYYDVIHDARKTVEAMSYQFPKWPYPYPHETVFDGLDQMEYPMMVNDNPLSDHAQSVELTDHEIFHTMFPFYMGVNETKYAWMDEGWATIGEWLISPMIDSTLVDPYGVVPVELSAGKETDLPIITLSTESRMSYFTNSYPKPAMGYLFVKDMLGDDVFNKGLHYYIQQWHGKHPIPYDFFNCMNAGSGVNMDWFWKAWFMENGIPDLAITSVKTTGKPSVVITSVGTKPVPIDLTVTFEDGSTQDIHRSIAVWEKGDKTVTIPLPKDKKIAKIVMGAPHTPDSNKKDNVWEAAS
ncbi:MAG TPA: M1 family metallopeptidase [Chitinophagaceae bacterium]|nr:M1 family metallopeptidase [Chitinophagaceae bacterium]